MENRKYKMYCLGCRGSHSVFGKQYLEFGGQTSCYIIKCDDYAMVIDCGTGLYEARDLLKDCNIIDVFLTHIHYDHVLGLLDFSVFPKKARVSFYAAFRNWFGADTLSEFYRKPFWPIQPWLGPLCEIPQDGTPCNLGLGVVVQNFPAAHPDNASVLYITLGDKTVCVMFDCEKADSLPMDLVTNSDILLYDGMYENQTYADKVGWGHSTWQEGCRLAKEANIKKLIITHHDPNFDDEELRLLEEEAKGMFANSCFARAGAVYEI